MRIAAALAPVLILALPGCSSRAPAGTTTVDINSAAEQAQDSIDNYAATPALSNATRADAAPASLPTPAPTPASTPPSTPRPAASLAPLDPPAPGTPGGLPDDRTPISEAPFTADSAQGAATVVQTYYALLGEKKYREAFLLWGHRGKDAGMSAEAFAASFDRYSEYHANVGAPGRIDAGMSQRRVTVPVQVYGRLKASGEPVYMLGQVVVRRVVPGVSADRTEQAWHLESTDIKPRPRS